MNRYDVERIKRGASDPWPAVVALGLDKGSKRQRDGGVVVLCPWHAEKNPSCSITIAPDITLRAVCFACARKGDIFALIAAVRGLDIRRDFPRVLQEAAQIAGIDPTLDGMRVTRRLSPRPRVEAAAPKRIPRNELDAFWGQTGPVNPTKAKPDVLEMGTCFFLAGRRLYPPKLAALDLARVTPLPDDGAWYPWWPKAWARSYRLVVRGYDAAGNFISVHGRSIVPGQTPKTRWPRGYSAGALFADRRGVALLRGDTGDTDRVVITEGMTDTIAMTMEIADAGRPHAVLGITSGATKTLRAVQWPKEIPIVIYTDGDAAGDKYAAEIIAAVPRGHEVRRASNPVNGTAVAR